MGIKGLSMLLQTHAPAAVREVTMEDLFGRKVAMDASMSIYQFMVAVRTASGSGGAEAMLMNEHGEVTSHLQGIFYRTIRMLENGLKPVFVFDGKPPTLKSDELQRRSTRREETSTQLEQATEEANQEDINKFSRRMVKVTKEHNEECRKLLQLMGIPVVQASGEAEAQCAALAKAGKVWATGTEDMDALTFGSPVLLRHLTFSAARKIPINEFHLDKALEGLGLTMDQFVDLCMLSGCDYLSPIRGIAGGKALQLLKKHGSLEKVLTNLDRKKYPVPESYPIDEVRKLFHEPDVVDPAAIELEWKDPDEEGIIQFLVNEKGFNLERVKSGIKKLLTSKSKGSQKRLDNFFTSMPNPNPSKKAKTENKKGNKISKKK